MKTMHAESEHRLEEAGIRPTANRLLVMNELAKAHSPLSLIELETAIDSMDRSSILRVLSLLREHGLVHSMEDGRGIAKYEICHSCGHPKDDDSHVHFYCERCNRVYCFSDIPIPEIRMPSGFRSQSVNYMIKGICPHCTE